VGARSSLAWTGHGRAMAPRRYRWGSRVAALAGWGEHTPASWLASWLLAAGKLAAGLQEWLCPVISVTKRLSAAMITFKFVLCALLSLFSLFHFWPTLISRGLDNPAKPASPRARAPCCGVEAPVPREARGRISWRLPADAARPAGGRRCTGLSPPGRDGGRQGTHSSRHVVRPTDCASLGSVAGPSRAEWREPCIDSIYQV
jgi:hypothetical protein